MAFVQIARQDAGCVLKDDRPAGRGSKSAYRNVWDAPAAMPPGPGEERMSLWKSLKQILVGNILSDEEEKSTQVRNDARRAIEETRAILDGEEFWLMRPDRENRNHCGQ